MNNFDISVDGIDKLAANLRIFTPSETKKIVVSALKESAIPIVVDMKKHAPKSTGELVKSIKAIVVKDREFGLAVIVRPHLIGATRRKAYYAKFLEGGTADRLPRKGAMYSNSAFVATYFKKAKGIKAKPFVAPVYSANKDKVALSVSDNVYVQINKVLNE